ncbi:hypothetical protein [Streptomyces atroolivaceus]|uniref:Uncharacterized protein n=1 Tax=Streptomyces atroolivaceus TaxID=66869 RepID=A0ABV9VF74_STRAZ|nr:hypothetical protein [Streptomyces atroolivaceus]
MPWVHQWYDEFDEEWDGNPAEEFQSALNLGRTERHLSESDPRAWRPGPPCPAGHQPAVATGQRGFPPSGCTPIALILALC